MLSVLAWCSCRPSSSANELFELPLTALHRTVALAVGATDPPSKLQPGA